MSIKGRKKFAWQLQISGLSEIDNDVPRGLALWITGAIIEATFTEGMEAERLRLDLEHLTFALENSSVSNAVTAPAPRAAESQASRNSEEPTERSKAFDISQSSKQDTSAATEEKSKATIPSESVQAVIDGAAEKAHEESRILAEKIRRDIGL